MHYNDVGAMGQSIAWNLPNLAFPAKTRRHQVIFAFGGTNRLIPK
jgi:hypothetical protein